MDGNALLRLDKALESTWDAYLAFLEDPDLPPEQADAFMARLEKEPDAELGYCTRYLHVRTNWLIRLGRHEDAIAAWIQGKNYGAGQNGYDWDLFSWLEDDPVLEDVNRRYIRQMVVSSDWKMPLIRLERGTVRRGRMKDAFDNAPLRKGDDVFLLRRYWLPDPDTMAVRPELFDADPELAENRRKYEHDAYDLRDYRTIHANFHQPFMNYFLATATPETLDIPALLRTAATVRGGDFAYGIATGVISADAFTGEMLFAADRNVNDRANGDVVPLLYILKKCGYLDAVFNALPELPDDFPLLLMCFADAAIRKRVEDYMGIPGLAAMYDLAFAPRRLTVREQLALVQFGRANPRFQELLGASLFRYGYHLHYRSSPEPDRRVQEFAHFRNGFCADVLLFLLSAPETLPQLRQLLDYGPEARLTLSEGFYDGFACFSRNILGYLALNGDARLPRLREAWLEKEEDDRKAHRPLKTAALLRALQKESRRIIGPTS